MIYGQDHGVGLEQMSENMTVLLVETDRSVVQRMASFQVAVMTTDVVAPMKGYCFPAVLN
jgi:hypothetical protein